MARSWARAQLTDHVGPALVAVVVPSAAALVLYLWFLRSGYTWIWLRQLSGVGGLVGVAATAAFLTYFRAALSSRADRQRLGSLWDVGTFWPRACQPFAPPSYAERAVPEVATRLRRITGDQDRMDEPPRQKDPAVAEQLAEGQRMPGNAELVPVEEHCRVLLTGYSQGAPICVAVLSQLPKEVLDHLAFLTLNAPVRRLYGQTFPAYFGTNQRVQLKGRLSDRWVNITRYTDYVGGWVFDPKFTGASPSADIYVPTDRVVMDPPVLWRDGDVAAPPTHQHSDVFSDPQMFAIAETITHNLRVGSTGRGRPE